MGIKLIVGDVEVTGNDDWLIRMLRPDSADVVPKGSVVSPAVFDALQILPDSWNVDIDQYEALEVERQDPAFLAVLTLKHILRGKLGQVLGEDSDTGVS